MNDKGRILVVDDTLASLKLMADTLRAEGYEVYSTDSGELALGAAARKRPELVLCDMRMPGMDGLEVCRRLKQQPDTRDIPLMFISAASAVDERVQGFAAGAVDFVAKPFQRDELLARVQTHLELARLRGQLEQRVQDALAALREMHDHLEIRVMERTSELENAHSKLRTASGRLAQAERMAALVTMVSGVAREVAQPVAAGLGLAQRLQRDLAALAQAQAAAAPPDLERMAGQAAQLAQHLDAAAGALHDFLHLAPARGGEARSAFELSALVGEVLASQLKLLKSTLHQVRVDIAPGLMLDGFPRALAQVLTNLISNALTHAFEEGAAGEIRLTASLVEPGQLRLVVADNGKGIDPADLPHVFEPLFSTRHGQGRRGLGLSLAYATVAEVLGGTLTAANDGGAVFTLELPLHALAEAAAVAAS